MAGIPNRLRIAVVGERASGKSYLLYDLIHAFGLLGYEPEELPLSYPHSSFGTYFYDTFNSETGGMRGTERYACRPDNHYGAWLSRNSLGRRLEVDFLNIPGEMFDLSHDRMSKFFNLKQMIERRQKGLFILSVWRNPAGHEERLIVHKDLNLANGLSIKPSSQQRFGNYLNWNHLRCFLYEGRYKEVSRQPVSGRYLLRHLTTLQTDSVLLTIEDCWESLTSLQTVSLEDYKAGQVLFYFYPLVYCQQATDLIICDNLMQENNVGNLAESVAEFMKESSGRRPHAYLAFRGVDGLLKRLTPNTGKMVSEKEGTDASTLNSLYEWMMKVVIEQMKNDGGQTESFLPDGWPLHIRQSLGDGVGQAFWHLLNASVDDRLVTRVRNMFRKPTNIYDLTQQPGWRLPPHVYFTATPIDASCRIYMNDPDDITRFYHDDEGMVRSFTTEVNSGRSRHLCLGAYQLLTDILLQNGICSEGMRYRGEHLQYIQSKL